MVEIYDMQTGLLNMHKCLFSRHHDYHETNRNIEKSETRSRSDILVTSIPLAGVTPCDVVLGVASFPGSACLPRELVAARRRGFSREVR